MNQPHLFRGYSDDLDMFIIGYYYFDLSGRLFIKDSTLMQDFEVRADSLGVHCDSMTDCLGKPVFASYSYTGKFADVLSTDTYDYYIVCEGAEFVMVSLTTGNIIHREFITYFDKLKGVLKWV